MADSKQVLLEQKRRPRILIGVTGSVAAVKVPYLVKDLGQFADVRVIATDSALRFLTCEAPLPDCITLLGNEDEWRQWQNIGDEVMHIELRRWADVLLVAPLSANSLAKLAAGLCDNLLTCVVRAWDFKRPLLVAPAMNTQMWDSSFTAKHLAVLQELGVEVIPPQVKRLACGDNGMGAMAAVSLIVDRAAFAMSKIDCSWLQTNNTAVDGET